MSVFNLTKSINENLSVQALKKEFARQILKEIRLKKLSMVECVRMGIPRTGLTKMRANQEHLVSVEWMIHAMDKLGLKVKVTPQEQLRGAMVKIVVRREKNAD